MRKLAVVLFPLLIFTLVVVSSGCNQKPSNGTPTIVPSITLSPTTTPTPGQTPIPSSTTVGELSLISTFRSVSVYASFTGDDNENNSAIMEYRVSGGTWHQGMDLVVDRRPQIEDQYGLHDNPFYLQWRGSIVGLTENTSYDVRVTFTDSDGVTGTNPVSDTLSTRSSTFTLGTGSTYYVATDGDNGSAGTIGDPWLTISYSLSQMGAGDTLYVRGGTYNESGLNGIPSGTSWSNLTSIIGYSGETAIIDGGGSAYIFRPNSKSYFRIQNLELNDTGKSKVRADSCSNFIIEDNTIDGTGGGYTGAIMGWNSSGGIIRKNILDTDLSGGPEYYGIMIDATVETNGGWIIYGNRITGNKWYDAIGGSHNDIHSGFYRDSDIYDNYAYDSYDDFIELESGGSNIRVWGNEINDSRKAVFSLAPLLIGPVYVFNNTAYFVDENSADPAFKNGSSYGNPSEGYLFAYNNSFYRVGLGPASWAQDYDWHNHTYLNNIFHYEDEGSRFRENEVDPITLDYNLYKRNGGSERTAVWCGSGPGCNKSAYATTSAFFAASGHEENGIDGDPLFVDPTNGDLTLQAGSPAIDAGVIITGFNDAYGPYPYSGTAPDIGAYEYR